MKDFLGIKVARSKQAIFMSQCKYVLDLLKEMGLLGCKLVATPINANTKLRLSEDENSVVDRGKYQRLVGRLIYLSSTRPNIAFVVSLISQFMHCPSEEHMEAVFRILKYLKSNLGKGILFTKYEK